MYKNCACCGVQNDRDALFCVNCGAPLPPAPENRAMPRCANCGAELFPENAYCTRCGAPSGYAPQPRPAQSAAPKKRTAAIVLLCVGFAVAAAVTLALVVLLLNFTVEKVPSPPSSAASALEPSFSLPGGDIAPHDPPQVEHPSLNFDSIEYARPDMDALSGKIAACLSAARSGAPADEVLSQADGILDGLNSALTMYALADLKSSLDYADEYYNDEYSWLLDKLDSVDVEFNELTAFLADSELYSGALTRHWGEDFVGCCLSAGLMNNDEAAALLSEEKELSGEYDVLAKETAVAMFGRDWTYDDIAAATELSNEDYFALYDAYCRELNKEAGALFLELISLRVEIAKTLGYSSYTDYAYDSFGRDYGPADAKRLQKAVKAYLAPLYPELYELSYNTNYSELYSIDSASGETLPAIYSAAESVSPNIAEAMRYMLTSGLYDIEPRAEKVSGGFTIFLTDHHAPFLYTNWDGHWASVTEFIHELGHFNSYYWRAENGWNVPDGTDIAEVDSQGLVLLTSPQFEQIFGAGVADASRMELLLDTMYTILSGCMEDEFQQAIYADPGMTLEEINALYYELSVEYGLYGVHNMQPEEWVLIPHTFQSPLYYISYAAAMIPSAEIWMLSRTDFDNAVTVYENVVFRDTYDSFLTVLSDSSLPDPFEPEVMRKLCAEFEAYGYELAG